MLQGPIVLVADQPNAELVAALRAKGGTAVAEATWAGAADVIVKSWPVAVVLDEAPPATGGRGPVAAIVKALAAMREPYLPLFCRVFPDMGPAIDGALPIAANCVPQRVAGRVVSALRVRTLHATVFRRAASVAAEGGDVPEPAPGDPLDDATVLVVGRGRSYPDLTTAVGERVGLIGALSVENAARHLASRHLDGIVIGDGFGPPMTDAFLAALSEDARFRDLPIALLAGIPVHVDCSRMPNLDRLDGTPRQVVEWMLPMVRLHAYEARLQRQLAAIEARGMLDPETGLFTVFAFLRDLNQAAGNARSRRATLSLARLSFERDLARRTGIDAARQVGRLIRSVDFACRSGDGSILVAFPDTPLQTAHVVARRVAAALRATMLESDRSDGHADPMVTLAALKPMDDVDSLLARVSEPAKLAAE